MADDLSLLFKLKADNAQAKSTIAETRAAVAQLRTSFGSDFAAMQSASKSALSDIGSNLNLFVGERIPLVGGAFIRVTENLHGLHDEMKKGGPEVEKLAQSIDKIAQSTGKSTHEVTTFLTSFVQLETQAKRDAAAIETFGASAAGTLIPQLEKAGTELTTVAVASESAGVGLASMAGPIGIVVLAVGALAAGLAVATEQVFEITKATAEWEGKLLDLSQQTGVSVETLSALEVVAKTTGGSIETIVASLGIFQKHLEAAQDPTSKEALLLKQLGIDSNNTEEALRQSLTVLSKMPEGFRQTATALELFGRGGKALLAILKETGGDLDGTIERLDKMGILVHTETAKAADEFNDSLAILGFQLRATTAIIGNEAMPTILQAIKDVTKVFQDNRAEVVGWAHDIGDATKGTYKLAEAITFLGGQVSGLSGIPIPNIIRLLGNVSGASGIFDALKALGAPTDIGAIPVPDLADPLTAPGRGSTVKTTKAKKDLGPHKAFEDQLQALKDAASERAKVYKDETDDLKREFERQQLTQDEYFAKEHEKNDAHIKDVNEETEHELRVLAAGLAKKLVTREEYDKKARAIANAQSDAQRAHDKRDDELIDEEAKTRARQILDLEHQLAGIRAQARADELTDLQLAINAQSQVEDLSNEQRLANDLRLIDKRKEIERQDYEERKLLLDLEREQKTTSADRLIAIDNELILAEQKWTAEDKRLTQERINAVNAEARAEFDRQNAIGSQGATRPRQVFKQDAFKLFGDSLQHNLSGDKLTAATAGLQVMSGAFQQLGQAVGEAVHSFVLFGTAGVGLRQFTAELIANIAQMAAVQAVWELAQGLAMLAMNFFWPDPRLTASATAHFHAAAIYGGLALVAAGAGRAVAGGSFAQGAGASGGGAGSGGGGGRSAPSPAAAPTSATTARNQAPTIELHLHGSLAALKATIVKTVINDADLNGPTRAMIVKHST